MRIPLRTERGRRIYYDRNSIENIKKELEKFLLHEDFIYSNEFIKNILEPENIIQDEVISGKKLQSRINKYQAYKFILKQKEIEKNNLRELYNIRSKNLLDQYSIDNMGKYYRESKVFILKNNSLLDSIQAMKFTKVDSYVERLFEYINSGEESSDIDEFIKSQIIHFYLYYIHPYFDINKRTSKTLGLWYLINKNNYKYLLFESGISLNKNSYNKSIFESRTGNITSFIRCMLENTKMQMEIKSVVQNIQSHQNLSNGEKKIIEYLLKLNYNPLLKDIIDNYNVYNAYKMPTTMIKKYIWQLIEKEVINLKKEPYKISKNNFILALNEQMIDLDYDNYNINIKKLFK